MATRRTAANPHALLEGPRAAVEGPSSRLSDAQERFWFQEQIDGGSGAYNVPLALRLTGHVQVQALERALNEVVARHDALRATFHSAGGAPVQCVAPHVQIEIARRTVDRAGIEAAVADEAARPFRLEIAPLVRASLLSIDGKRDEHVLVLVVHHIAVDRWSLDVMHNELLTAYDAFVDGKPSPLTSAPDGWLDWVEQQRRRLDDGDSESDLSYWDEALRGAPPLIGLPTDQPRLARPTHRGRTHSVCIDRDVVTALRAIARREGVTLYRVLLAAFVVLLHRYSGDEDVVVGVPVSGRTADTDQMVGLFINTLALRARISPSVSFLDLVRTIGENFEAGLSHQDAPFNRVVERLGLSGTRAHSPLVQVLFQGNHDRRRAMTSKLQVEEFVYDRGTAQMDLAVEVFLNEDPVRCKFQYNADLFESSTIARLASNFFVLLHAAADAPDEAVASMRLVDEDERRILVNEWNDTATDYDLATPLHQLVETATRRNPDATILVGEDRSLTASEMNDRANRLAAVLRERGVGPGEIAAVLLERSIDSVVALLAVNKAGGAFLPLDPLQPPARLAQIIDSAHPRVVVSSSSFTSRLPASAMPLVIELDAGSGPTSTSVQPAAHADPADPSYVIFTSGSTGQPKGVVIPQRGIANRLHWMQETFSLGSDDAVLHKTPLIFDTSVWEVFWPLMTGAQLVVAPPESHRDPRELIRLVKEHGITVIDVVPSMLRALLAERAFAECTSLRLLISGGEELAPDLADSVLDRLPVVLYNAYGPTEASIGVAFFRCSRGLNRLRVPIGRPISNVQLHVLDDRRQVVPIGVQGELFIGGAALASGYLGRPDLTAERFVTVDLGLDRPVRLYRTGDRARFGSDGNLEFMGRVDRQIKLHGFRIEPAEIEATLLRHPAVSKAFVDVREDRSGDERLVAYAVPAPEAIATATDLRTFLAESLPSYMVPSAVVLLDALPLAPSGKIDRSALPAPVITVAAAVPPRTDLERAVLSIWQDILGIAGTASVTDDFFDSGGHSLLAVELFARIADDLGVELPLGTLFESATVERLAEAVRAARDGTAPVSPLVPIRARGSWPPLFLAPHGISGDVLGYGPLVTHLPDELPVYGLRCQAMDGRELPHDSIEGMAAYFVAAVREVQPVGPYLLGGYCFGGAVAYEMARQLELGGEQVPLVALIDVNFSRMTFGGIGPKLRREVARARTFMTGGAEEKRAYLRLLQGRARGLSRRVRRGSPPPTHENRPVIRSNAWYDLSERVHDRYIAPTSSLLVDLFLGPDPIRTAWEMSRWKRTARGGVEVHLCTSGAMHDPMFKEPHVSLLAREFDRSIRRALSR